MKIYIQARGSYETLLNLSNWAEQNEYRENWPARSLHCWQTKTR